MPATLEAAGQAGASCKGPFGVFGLVAGLLAGSLLLPFGCGPDEDESLRLRVGLPLLAPIIFLLTALVIDRFLQSRPSESAARGGRDWTIPGSGAVVLAGMATLGVAAVALYFGMHLVDGSDLHEAPQLFFVALVVLRPVLAPGLVALPLVARASQVASEARAPSPVVRAARRVRWSFVAAATHTAAAFVVVLPLLEEKPPALDPRLFGAAAVACAVLLAVSVGITARVFAERRQQAAAERSLMIPTPTPYRSPADSGAAGAARTLPWTSDERSPLLALAISLAAVILAAAYARGRFG